MSAREAIASLGQLQKGKAVSLKDPKIKVAQLRMCIAYFIPRGSLALPDSKCLPKQRVKVKRRSLHLVETIILTARLLQKGTIYSKEQLFYCYKELRFKTSRKERSNRRLSLRESIRRIPELFDKKFEQRTVELSLFSLLDPTEYWGMIREWVYLFSQTVN